jgi:hypothetical protein
MIVTEPFVHASRASPHDTLFDAPGGLSHVNIGCLNGGTTIENMLDCFGLGVTIVPRCAKADETRNNTTRNNTAPRQHRQQISPHLWQGLFMANLVVSNLKNPLR